MSINPENYIQIRPKFEVHSFIFCAPQMGFPWIWVPPAPKSKGTPSDQGKKTRMMELSGQEPRKKFDHIFSCLYTTYECDGRTDRRTDTGRQQRSHVHIASRGKTA